MQRKSLPRRYLSAAELGRKIKEARESQGVSTQQLGDVVGLTSQQIRRMEAGKAEVSAVVLGRVAKALHVSADTLLSHVKTEDVLAAELWKENDLDNQIAASTPPDFKAKRSILKALGLWRE